jgi:gliding motility-associated-like protein
MFSGNLKRHHFSTFNPIHIMRKIYLFYILFCLAGVCFRSDSQAQQGNIWHYGQGAGTQFYLGGPAGISNGQTNTLEGTASICDENADLLFYTDGVTVWDKTHQPMPNGQGLKGNKSAFQAAAIIPQPGDPSTFYIITADAIENSGNAGYHVSTVNMGLNGGKGDITLKNRSLVGKGSERIGLVMANNLIDYWVILNDWGGNTFYAFKVDCDGFSFSPVTSSVGISMAGLDVRNVGALKCSPDGRFICQTNYDGTQEPNPTQKFAQLFDFDASTGIVSQPRKITLPGIGYYSGCEFAPNSQVLYLANTFNNEIHQYNLSTPTEAAILQSLISIPASTGPLYGLQLAPDKKIYVNSSKTAISVIDAPNTLGTGCNLRILTASSSNRPTGISFPDFVPNFFANRPLDFDFRVIDSCTGTIEFLGEKRIGSQYQIEWDFGDGTRSTLLNPIHQFPNPGQTYRVKLKLQPNQGVCGIPVCTKRLIPGGNAVSYSINKTVDCDRRTFQGQAIISGTPQSAIQFSWDMGDGTVLNGQSISHQYANTGNYIVQLRTSAAGGCGSDTIPDAVSFVQPMVQVSPDREINVGETISLQATGAATYVWSPTTYLDNPTANPVKASPLQDIRYTVKGTNSEGCTDTASVLISVNTVTGIWVPNGFTPDKTQNNRLMPIIRGNIQLERFRVFDRWGHMVFQTAERGAGWDGKIEGNPAPTGAYVWEYYALNPDGTPLKEKGSAMLIR